VSFSTATGYYNTNPSYADNINTCLVSHDGRKHSDLGNHKYSALSFIIWKRN
jgi:hypothetical protein